LLPKVTILLSEFEAALKISTNSSNIQDSIALPTIFKEEIWLRKWEHIMKNDFENCNFLSKHLLIFKDKECAAIKKP
jgi:hypothetical protein